MTHQALGVTAGELLALMKEIAPLVKYGPASDTYWSQRDQMEQVLRQERLG